MANDTTSLFQSLVAGASKASEALKFRNAFLDSIYWDYKPMAVSPYTGLNVIIPSVNEGDVVDIGSGPLQMADTNHTAVQIPFNRHLSSSFTIKDWDQKRTPKDLQGTYLQPKLEGFTRTVNQIIANLVNTTNFSTYSLISGAGADLFNRSDLTGAWKNLANAGAPIEDDGNMSLIMSTAAYGNMLSDANFITQYITGGDVAVSAQQQAKIRTLYGCEVKYDQHIAKFNTGKEPAIFLHRYAIAAVTAPLMAPDDSTVQTTSFRLKGVLPVQMQMQYSIKDQGHVVNLHSWFGVKVVRPELASLIETA